MKKVQWLMAAALTIQATSVLCAQQNNSNWYRDASISPNGQELLFTAKGDIYKVPIKGGAAIPLTMNSAWDGHPVWSKDGASVAFSSDRNGSLDVYTMSAQGGTPTRLTFHSADDIPSDFSANGKAVIFSSSRANSATSSGYPTGAMPELYSVSIEGGTPEQILTTPALEARFSQDGSLLAYMDNKAYENKYRKHDISAFARDIWVMDTQSNAHKRLTQYKGADSTPVWSNSGKHIYYLSEQGLNNFNVWKMPVTGGASIQITEHETHPVRSLSISNNNILAYSWHGNLYTVKEGEKPQLIELTVMADKQDVAIAPKNIANKANEMAVSPSGKEVAFVSRGEVFVTSTEFDTTLRITNTPEQERSVSWSKDGRSLIYAAERNNGKKQSGQWGLYQSSIADEDEAYFFTATKITEKSLDDSKRDSYQPKVSPDGKKVAFLHQRDEIRVLTIATGKITTALDKKYNYSYADGDISFDWSPDSKWLVADYVPSSRVFISSIAIVPADGSAPPRDISLSGYADYAPKWVNSNTIIYASARYGRRSHGSWGAEGDIMALFLSQDALDKHFLSKEERALETELEEKAKEKDAKDEDSDEKEDEQEIADVEIEWDNIKERSVRLTIHSSSLGDAIMTPDGNKLYYLAKFEKGFDLWVQDFAESSTKLAHKLGADNASLQLDAKGESLFVLADGAMQKIEISSDESKAITYKGIIGLQADAERQYMFEHIWRQTKDKFYDPNMHGIDWDLMGKDYGPKIQSISHNRDFAIIMSEMLGELNASHTGSGYRNKPSAFASTASLGVLFEAKAQKQGLLISEVLPYSPLKRSKTEITKGMLLTHIDGKPVNIKHNLFDALNGKQGKRVRLSIKNGRKSFDTVIRPISLSDEKQALYTRWVDSRRAYVNSISKGKIGYVHVKQMDDDSFREVYSDLFGPNFEKKAVVIDTRFNSGGWLHDDLVVLFNGKQYTKMLPRGREYAGDPIERWTKPSIVLMNEGNYSDGYIFPVAYKAYEIGQTVGMPVPGTGTPVWWETLLSGDVYFGIPQIAVTDMQGNVMENNQLEPDILVNNSPESVAKGEDEQLKRAVQALLTGQ